MYFEVVALIVATLALIGTVLQTIDTARQLMDEVGANRTRIPFRELWSPSIMFTGNDRRLFSRHSRPAPRARLRQTLQGWWYLVAAAGVAWWGAFVALLIDIAQRR
jgi:hypothetical protein